MFKQEQKERFAELMQDAGFQDITHLAQTVVLNLPKEAVYPLDNTDLTRCISSIERLLYGNQKVIGLDGNLLPLALEIATLLNTTPQYLFKENIADSNPGPDGIHYPVPAFYGTAEQNPHRLIAGRNLLKIQDRFTVEEWDFLCSFYGKGLSVKEVAEQTKRIASNTQKIIDKIDEKLKAILSEGLFFEYINESSEYSLGFGRHERIETINKPSLTGEFRRTAYKASIQRDNVFLEGKAFLLKQEFIGRALNNDGFAYLQASIPELIDVIHGISDIKMLPDPILMEAWRNSFAETSPAFRSDELSETRNVILKIQARLNPESVDPQAEPYELAAFKPEKDRIKVELAVSDILQVFVRRLG